MGFIDIALVKNFYIALLSAILLCGCSIQQRRHTSGLSIQWPSIGHSGEKRTTDQKNAPNKHQDHLPNTQQRTHVGSFSRLNQPYAEADKTAASMSFTPLTQEVATRERFSNFQANYPLSPEKSVAEKSKQKTHRKQSKSKQVKRGRIAPGDDPILDLIFLIVGIIGALLGYDTYSGGGGGWGGGGYFDWTAFFAIGAIVLGAGGLIATAASKASMGATGLQGMMIFFTIFGGLFGLIGLIKSVRDYYDVGKYLSLGAFALLAIMWIIGLV